MNLPVKPKVQRKKIEIRTRKSTAVSPVRFAEDGPAHVSISFLCSLFRNPKLTVKIHKLLTINCTKVSTHNDLMKHSTSAF